MFDIDYSILIKEQYNKFLDFIGNVNEVISVEPNIDDLFGSWVTDDFDDKQLNELYESRLNICN